MDGDFLYGKPHVHGCVKGDGMSERYAIALLLAVVFGAIAASYWAAAQPTEYRVVYTTGYDAGKICYTNGDEFLWYAQKDTGTIYNKWQSAGPCGSDKGRVEERLSVLKANLEKSRLSKEGMV